VKTLSEKIEESVFGLFYFLSAAFVAAALVSAFYLSVQFLTKTTERLQQLEERVRVLEQKEVKP